MTSPIDPARKPPTQTAPSPFGPPRRRNGKPSGGRLRGGSFKRDQGKKVVKNADPLPGGRFGGRVSRPPAKKTVSLLPFENTREAVRTLFELTERYQQNLSDLETTRRVVRAKKQYPNDLPDFPGLPVMPYQGGTPRVRSHRIVVAANLTYNPNTIFGAIEKDFRPRWAAGHGHAPVLDRQNPVLDGPFTDGPCEYATETKDTQVWRVEGERSATITTWTEARPSLAANWQYGQDLSVLPGASDGTALDLGSGYKIATYYWEIYPRFLEFDPAIGSYIETALPYFNPYIIVKAPTPEEPLAAWASRNNHDPGSFFLDEDQSFLYNDNPWVSAFLELNLLVKLEGVWTIVETPAITAPVQVVYESLLVCVNANTPPLPPPPPPPPDDDCMGCCEELISYLKRIDANLTLLSNRMGAREFPASVPESLRSGDGIPSGQSNIQNLSQLVANLVKYLDETMGHWEQVVEIEDTDLTQDGDQKATIKLPNVAETLAEMMGLLINSTSISQAILKSSVATLVEAGTAHRVGVETRSIAEATQDFLAYETKQIKVKEPFAFQPGKTDIDELLDHKEIDIKVYEFSDKQTMRSYLTELMTAAAIIRAVHWKQIDPNGDVQQQVKDWLNESASQLGDSDSASEDFDQFLLRAEQGFTQEAGNTTPTTPYGRDFDRRPKIIELGTNQTD